MARKTFISYKYSEAQDLRDAIIMKLGKDAQYYQGETADSPDLTDTSVENIKKNLKDMMYGSSVTIVIISPNIKKSKWIDWELSYCLKEITREGRTSRMNGIVGVVMKYNGTYDWLFSHKKYPDGCSSRSTDSSKLYDIINANRFNYTGSDKYTCVDCKTVDKLKGSYISLIEEDVFLKDPFPYIENAYNKREQSNDYEIIKEK